MPMRAALTGAAWWCAFILLGAVGVHLLTVRFLPTALMGREMQRLAGDDGVNTALFPPPASPTSRGLARGDPNLLLAACVFDLTQRNLRVHATVPRQGHWSITIYGEDAKPFFFLSNETSQGGTFDRTLAGPGSLVAASGKPSVVSAPSFRGIILVRTLIDAGHGVAAADSIRRSVSCEATPR
jgi:uncharacterized membrane protein